jgi:hypothetical protein
VPAVVHRARCAIVGGHWTIRRGRRRRCLMALSLGGCGCRWMRGAALSRHERRQRRRLEYEPGSCPEAQAPAD